MAEQEKMQDEQNVQEEQSAGQEKKPRIAVSRKEFYICVALLLILIYARTGAILKNQREMTNTNANNANFISSRLDAMNGVLYNLTDGTDQADLLDSDVDISAVDWQNKTATLRLMAEPTEYQEGMMVTFFLSCDDGKAIPVAASAGEDYIYTAEQEIPFCEYVRVKVHIRRGDVEQIREFYGLSMMDELYPQIDSYPSSIIAQTFGATEATVGGDYAVEIQAPQWMLQNNKTFEVKNPRVEISVNGRRVKTLPMEKQDNSDYYTERYSASIAGSERITLQEGDRISFVFKMEDGSGTKYSYVMEEARQDQQEGYVQEQPATPIEDENSRLTIE